MTDKKSERDEGTRLPAAPPAPAPTASADKRTPEEWAAVCGQRRPKTFEETVTMVNGKPFDFVGPFL
jgi:hypothetical protein